MNSFFAQATPWGLTYGQTALIVGGAVGLLVIWSVLRFFLRLGRSIFQCGCLLILLFVGGAAASIFFFNMRG